MRRAAIADKKRYGEDKEGTTINVGVQTNVQNNIPESLEDLHNMSISSLMDTQRPGTI